MPDMRFILLLAAVATVTIHAEEIVFKIPADMKISESRAVTGSWAVQGKRVDGGLRFARLKPDVPYTVVLELADGTAERGVDMSWHNSEKANPDAGALDDDDKQQITSILKDIKSFYDRTDALAIAGNHDRAVVLVQRIRDSKFHSGAQGECDWRVELWYIKNEAGGWAKVNQQDKLLRRERFESSAAMKQTIDKIHWRPELGGIRLKKDEVKTIEFSPAAATTKPSTAP
jgi:hypothetical protein